jgi:hypothetical protein
MKQKTVTVTHLGMDGDGPNKTLAKKNAEERIASVLSGDWQPTVIVHNDLVAVITRTPSPTPFQWGFKVVEAAAAGLYRWMDFNYTDKSKALHAAAYSLAQRTGSYDGLTDYLSANDVEDLKGYFIWQTAYATQASQGQPEEACRRAADLALADSRKVPA